MDIKQYYGDISKKRAELEEAYESGEVYLTSLFHREKNSTAGQVSTATPENAARVLVDGTHKLSSEDEVAAYKKLLERNRTEIAKAEQLKKQQYIVVVDQKQSASELSAALSE